ncbi:MAG: hypothetical protein HON14_12970, partial [Rhodospirillaceae bacterium]|nr:hypothetical protein [Rhodospirillaceae bacterium]
MRRGIGASSTLAGLILSVGFGAGVLAQTTDQKPTSLAPAKVLAPQPTPTQISAPQSQPQSLAPPPSTRVLVPLQINVEELKKIDSDSVGTLTEEQGGFGINMWEGTSRNLVEKLLPKLPVNSSS